jgi:hypothetical protein
MTEVTGEIFTGPTGSAMPMTLWSGVKSTVTGTVTPSPVGKLIVKLSGGITEGSDRKTPATKGGIGGAKLRPLLITRKLSLPVVPPPGTGSNQKPALNELDNVRLDTTPAKYTPSENPGMFPLVKS